VNAESDDKNYRMYKSATQQAIYSSNAVWLIKTIQKQKSFNIKFQITIFI
jgi:hypothetical protein